MTDPRKDLLMKLFPTDAEVSKYANGNFGFDGDTSAQEKAFESGVDWLKTEMLHRLSTLPPQGEWISVEDRLPEINPDTDSSSNVFAIVNGDVLIMAYVWVDDAEDENGKDVSGYVWANCCGDINGDAEWDNNYEVTHWQPLPSPPTKK